MVAGALSLAILGLSELVRLLVRHPVDSAVIAGAVVVATLLSTVIVARLAPGVRPGTVLELDLPSAPTEMPDRNPLAGLAGRKLMTLADTVDVLERASRDKHVSGLVLRPRFQAAPRAIVQELRDAVVAFGDTGKFTVAVADSFGEGEPANSSYYLATACHEVVLHPTGMVGLAPLSLEPNFYRGLLDRLGIDFEVLARHEFKTAFNRLSERAYTDADREQSQRLLDSLWEQEVGVVARARKLDPEQVRRLAENAPLLASQALDGGLVDKLAYTDEVISAAKARAGPKSKLLYVALYKKRAAKARQPRSSVPVGVLRCVGEIHRSSYSPRGMTGGPVVAADKLTNQIRAAAKDKKVKAFVLRIDSPGGSAVASDAIWRELTKLREKGKPLVVSMGAVAASGGYYIAAAADRVVAEPGTITGSIGVITVHPVLSKAKSKLDVTSDEVHTGAEPSVFSVNRPMSAAHHQRTDLQLDGIYDVFTKRVSHGRKLQISKVLDIAKGRVWTGSDAVDIGLVDELGGLQRALALAAELTGAPPGTTVSPKPIPPRPSGLARFRPHPSESSDDTAAVTVSQPRQHLLGPGRDAIARASSGLSRTHVMCHLGCDPRSYWLP